MLLIRNEQMDVLDSYMLQQFENLMVIHLNTYFPQKCQELGEKEVRSTIQYGVSKAKSYQIFIENDVSRYINLMFTFGRDFDTDENVPWASEILLNDDCISTQKMDLLYRESGKHIPEST